MAQETPASSRPEVSVIVASFNSRFLADAVSSALGQGVDLEVLVMDDGDAAGTRGALGDLLLDPRVRHFHNPVSLGPAANHERGLGLARGSFIGVLNHDDRWYPGALDVLLTPMRDDSDVVLSFADHDVIDDQGRVDPDRAASIRVRFGREGTSSGTVSWDRVVLEGIVPLPQAALFRSGLVTSVPVAVGSAYDRYLVISLARSGGRAVYTDAVLGSWRIHAEQLTQTNHLRSRKESAALSRHAIGHRATRSVRTLRWAARAHAGLVAERAKGIL